MYARAVLRRALLVTFFVVLSACKRTPPAETKPSLVVSMELGGSTPVQAEGKLRDGSAFYFRARNESWSFSVAPTAAQVFDEASWYWEEPWGDKPFAAGYMAEARARAIIESCAEMYEAKVAPPREDVGLSDERRTAERLARLIMADIALYEHETIADAGVAKVRTALAAKIDEGRAIFRKRTAPSEHAVFDEMLEVLDMTARDQAYHPRWIRDEASAQSVGRRWAAMLARTAPAEQAKVRDEGARWLSRWTHPSARAALEGALGGTGIVLR